MTRKKGFIVSMFFGIIILAAILFTAWLILGGEGIRDKLKNGLSDDEQSSQTNMKKTETKECVLKQCTENFKGGVLLLSVPKEK